MKQFFRAFIFINFLVAFFSNSFGQSAARKLDITPLSGNFYIFTTYNIYKGDMVPANGMYLVTDSGVVMFDSPWDTTQFQPILDSIKAKHNKTVVICIATHSHKDKTAGLEFLEERGVKTFTTRHTDEISAIKGEKRAAYLMEKDTVFSVGGYQFQIFYPGPGHTADNIVAWFNKEKILYGGCLVKSTEATDLGYVAEGNLQEWPVTIKRLQARFKNPKHIIPGHQSWTSNRSLVHTLKLLKAGK